MMSRMRSSEISVTTPAPTVRPPSRIANRSSFSIAIGTISSIAILTVFPGLTLSPPRRHRAHPRHVRRPEVKLRPVPVEVRRVPPPLFLRQHVHLGLELLVGFDRARPRQHLSPLHLLLCRSRAAAPRHYPPPAPRPGACGTSPPPSPPSCACRAPPRSPLPRPPSRSPAPRARSPPSPAP